VLPHLPPTLLLVMPIFLLLAPLHAQPVTLLEPPMLPVMPPMPPTTLSKQPKPQVSPESESGNTGTFQNVFGL
jgi:hypothetical protein